MNPSESQSDKKFCINCQLMRPKDQWRDVPLKGRKGTVKRCLVCLAKSKAAQARIARERVLCS